MHLQKDTYTISTDKDLLNIEYIHAYLSKQSYWAMGIPLEIVRKSIQGSLCFGIFNNSNQIGFARVITDTATFAYLADVFIDEKYRGQGLSKWLMETIMTHQDLQGLRRFMLATLDAHTLYEQYGFVLITYPERWMHIHYPNRYADYNLM